ncbi:ABC transporter substrate-binding protein [Petroclostridium sp. X23]|uniref:ABC transporter substrate-binding protein n=1 Tax=Petroclostridium sp. X23 TaxID=3045146 RepID=UPI0024ACBA19|nr:ABC transporter substrate-binding protein [Petroclostridium sp. X23]WHH59038.1 ABC transporter substrate-binding protein [Petroclostridium sp. X23]
MRVKGLAILLAVLLSVIPLGGCGGSKTATEPNEKAETGGTAQNDKKEADNKEQKKDGFVIGFANGYIGNTWRAQFVENFENAAKKYKEEGILKDFQVANSNADVTQQLNQLNSMINSGVDALMIDPVSATSLSSVVAKAKQKGILVVITNDPAAYEGTYAVIGNNDAFWRIQAKWIAEKLEGKGDIVQITGLAGNTADTLRVEAAKDVLSEYPGIKVLASVPGGWSQSEAQKVMSTFLSTYNKIDGILMQDVMAEGVLRAYENVGKELPLMTGDYTFSFLRAWKDKPEMESIGVPYAPGIAVDALRITIGLLQGKEIKEDTYQPNPLNPSLKNAVMIDPPYVVTKEGKQDAPWMEGLHFTKAITLDEAVKLGEGKASTAALDASLTDEQISTFFK